MDSFLNKIILGDCLEVMKGMPDKSVDLVLTDPPYIVTSRGGPGNTGGMLRKKVYNQGLVFKYNNIDVTDYAGELYRVLKPDSHAYVMCNHVNLTKFLNELPKVGFHFIKALIWDKGNKIMGQAYMSQFEYILFLRKGAFKKINNCGTSDILSIPNKKTKGVDGQNIHDTEKPVSLMEVLIENSTQEGMIVLDPFLGSGTTAIAALNTGRFFVGIEKDEGYCEIARKRVEQAQAQGNIFAEV